MEERIRQEFIEILKRLLSDLHNKKYEDIVKYVETSDDLDLMDYLKNDLEETLEDYGYEAIDEYGTLIEMSHCLLMLYKARKDSLSDSHIHL